MGVGGAGCIRPRVGAVPAGNGARYPAQIKKPHSGRYPGFASGFAGITVSQGERSRDGCNADSPPRATSLFSSFLICSPAQIWWMRVSLTPISRPISFAVFPPARMATITASFSAGVIVSENSLCSSKSWWYDKTTSAQSHSLREQSAGGVPTSRAEIPRSHKPPRKPETSFQPLAKGILGTSRQPGKLILGNLAGYVGHFHRLPQVERHECAVIDPLIQ